MNYRSLSLSKGAGFPEAPMSRIALAIIILASALAACGNKDGAKKKKDEGPMAVVTAPNGLVLRESPSREARALAVVPEGGRVRFFGVEQGAPFIIDGKTGRFTRVAWQGKTGWMFDGYLKREAIEPSISSNAGHPGVVDDATGKNPGWK